MTLRPHSSRPSRPALALLVGGSLALAEMQTGCATQQPFDAASPQTQAAYSASLTPAPIAPDQLDQLVAPIALYPDALVGQVLAAATYPTEIVEADRWIESNSPLKGDALAKAVDQQPWDPSVKALAQFPSVLSMMDKNLSWTSALGDAYGNNQATVMDAVQRMRRKAEQAGNLKSTAQETVTTQDDTIAIAPAEPQVVYVPQYDPWLVYGAPIAFYPDWVDVPGFYFDGPGIFFGAGIGIGLFSAYDWGWHHWGTDWHHHFVDVDHHHFVSHSPTFGHFRPTDGRGAFGRPGVEPRPGLPAAGFHGGGFHPGDFHPANSFGAMHSSAFSGFNHGGIANTYSARGAASFGASRGSFAGGGGSHAGGFGGGFHGGGGGGHR